MLTPHLYFLRTPLGVDISSALTVACPVTCHGDRQGAALPCKIKSKPIYYYITTLEWTIYKNRPTTSALLFMSLTPATNKKLSYRKETVRLLHNIQIRILH